jgi:dTDP-4-amino-4,6-dideoxygalactose transaminase
MRIPFNKPCFTGDEPAFIQEAIEWQHLSGNGAFTERCHAWFEREMDFGKVFLTPSCTDALEMAALLCAFEPGDEVILPSYTFVGTANAFLRAGARLVFADSCPDHPNISPDSVAARITPRTRAIVLVHYGGVACDMEAFLRLKTEHGLILIEDAAHAAGASWRGLPLGGIGDLGTFSFHETKNINCGQGGLLIVNRPDWVRKAEQVWFNGTNRGDFSRGLAEKYTWQTAGSCFMHSELNAAYLWGQLIHFHSIQKRRMAHWEQYREKLGDLSVQIPTAAATTHHNAHISWLLAPDETSRDNWLKALHGAGILAVFHYLPLHLSPYFLKKNPVRSLPHCERFAQTLIRMPLYDALSFAEIDWICEQFRNIVEKEAGLQR